MRLIHTVTLEMREFLDADNAPAYAILSHCWGENEVSFKEFTKETYLDGARYKKIIECCAYAKSRQRSWVWIDTCCIDKRSSAELSEAINSMYEWYAKAEECYAYLADDTKMPSNESLANSKLGSSRWFQRGWTLQELISPTSVVFLTRDWGEIGYKNKIRMTTTSDSSGSLHDVFVSEQEASYTASKEDITDAIASITGIAVDVLRDRSNVRSYSAAQRLSWMKGRETSRTEDLSYCLLGLFELNMLLLYGEGTRAFERLQKEILGRTGDESILVRSMHALSLFPASIRNFWSAGQVITALVYDRPSITVSTRFAELRLTDKRPGVFRHAEQDDTLAVRLNCAYPHRKNSLSPCVLVLR